MQNKIKVGIIGVGNCASALVQGVTYYTKHKDKKVNGIMFNDIGGYFPTDIEFVCAFDVDNRKVGKPLNEAIFAKPNCCRFFEKDVENDIIVSKGILLDGVSCFMLEQREDKGFRIDDESYTEDEEYIKQILKESEVEILLNYLPVGSNKATEKYAQIAIDCGVSFINCIPVLSLNNKDWQQKFIDANIPYIGSDMKSQIGASIISQLLQELAFSRGAEVRYHQQINIGGNTDFNNMMVQSRLADKKVSKENVIKSQNILNNVEINDDSIFAGPSTFIPYLNDNKVAYFNLRLGGFADADIDIDIKLSVQDSENSAGVVIDAIRFLKVAKEMGIVGMLLGPSAFTQKTPALNLSYNDSLYECEMLSKRKYTQLTKNQVKGLAKVYE